MSTSIKTIIALIILIILAIVGWLWYGASSPTATPNEATSENQAYVPANESLTTSASDASDAALEKDLNSVGSQLNSLNTDATGIDQSLNNL